MNIKENQSVSNFGIDIMKNVYQFTIEEKIINILDSLVNENHTSSGKIISY